MKSFYIFFILIICFYIFSIQALPLLAAESSFIKGLTTSGTGAGYPDSAEVDPMNFIAKMLGQAVTPMFMGVSGMLSIAYGGYKWMMARGNEQDIDLAKTIITNTIIAMVVAFSAYAIVDIVINLLVIKTGV